MRKSIMRTATSADPTQPDTGTPCVFCRHQRVKPMPHTLWEPQPAVNVLFSDAGMMRKIAGTPSDVMTEVVATDKVWMFLCDECFDRHNVGDEIVGRDLLWPDGATISYGSLAAEES
jgi:hypothetical protein